MLIQNLKNGRVVLTENKEVITLPSWVESSPNNRLIRQTKKKLVTMGFNCKMVDPNKSAKILLSNSSNKISTSERVIVQSRPLNGISYVNCTVLNSAKLQGLEDQLSVSFVANDADHVVSKLIKYGFVKLHKDKKCSCEYHLGCSGICKKGGENE